MKFSALRTVATLLRVIAVLEGIVGMYAAIVAASDPKGSSTVVFAVTACGVAFKVLLTLAFAEAIGVFLAIEQSTRRTADAMASKSSPAATVTRDESESDDEPGPSSTGRFIKCRSCGKKTEADSSFCQKCGKPVAGG
jgi:zinc ribbon protein